MCCLNELKTSLKLNPEGYFPPNFGCNVFARNFISTHNFSLITATSKCATFAFSTWLRNEFEWQQRIIMFRIQTLSDFYFISISPSKRTDMILFSLIKTKFLDNLQNKQVFCEPDAECT